MKLLSSARSGTKDIEIEFVTAQLFLFCIQRNSAQDHLIHLYSTGLLERKMCHYRRDKCVAFYLTQNPGKGIFNTIVSESTRQNKKDFKHNLLNINF